MRKLSTFPLLLIFLTIFTIFSQVQAAPLPATGTVYVYFSPNDGATNAIVTELNNDKSEILVQAYSFTSAPIAKALTDANKRGVHIEVVLDRSQISDKVQPFINVYCR
jgi:phosphatidylserine/phosphatidylglycerophosphate/cardiolipin synthase-like enzyme